MGVQRHPEDPHPGSGPSPKLILAGRLDGFVNGRPVGLVADGRDVTLEASVGTLLALRRYWRPVTGPLRTVLAPAGLRLQARVGWFGRVQLLPDANWFVRRILPRH